MGWGEVQSGGDIYIYIYKANPAVLAADSYPPLRVVSNRVTRARV